MGGGQDDTADRIYRAVMEQVKVYASRQFIRDKLETIKEHVNRLRSSMWRAVDVSHLSFSDRLAYQCKVVQDFESISYSIRHNHHLSDSHFCLAACPILHAVQAVEIYAFAQHEWMLQGESFGDVP